MAKLPASIRTNLAAWFRGDDYVDGNPITKGYWPDASGNGWYLTGTATGGYPIKEARALNGHAVVSFTDGSIGLTSADSGAVTSDFITNSTGTVYTVVRIDALNTNAATWHENDTVWRGLGSACGIVLKSTPAALIVNDDGAADSVSVTVAAGNWYILIWRHTGGNLYAGEGAPDSQSSTASSNTTTVNLAMVFGQSSVPGYADIALAEMLLFKQNHTAQTMSQILGYLKAKYFSARDAIASAKYERGDALEQARAFGGQRLLEMGRARTHIVEDLPLEAMDEELLTDVWLSHPLGRGATWGTSETERRHVRLYASDWDIDRKTASQTFRDLRDLQHTYWESGDTSTVCDETRQGQAVCAGAAIRVMRRASPTWVLDPGTGRWAKVLSSTEAVSADGITLRPARMNILPRSSFGDGIASLSVTAGNGTGTFDTSVYMFDESAVATPGSLKIVAGNPNTTGYRAGWPVTAVDPNTAELLALVVWHRDDGGEPLSYSLYDTTSTKYWTTAGGWGAAGGAEAFNTITLGSATAFTEYVEYITPESAHGAASTWRVRIKQPDGGTASRINYVGHVEVQTSVDATPQATAISYRSGLIVTDASEVIRESDELWLDDPLGIINVPQGTLRFEFRPEWSAAQLWSTALFSSGGATYVEATWDGSSDTLSFGSSASGPASIPWTPVAGTWYQLAFRYTGATGELGLPAQTFDVFIDGAKGTSAASAGALSGFGSPFWWSDQLSAGTDPLATRDALVPGGTIRGIRFSPYCLTDAEIAAGVI